MTSRPVKLSIFILLIALFANPAQALVLDFEPLYYPIMGSLDGRTYGGLTWDANLWTIPETTYNGIWQNNIAFPSGNVALYNNGIVPNISIKGPSFDFNGAYFASWALDNYGSTTITMTGFASGNMVGSVTYSLSDTFEYYSAGLLNIDTLVLTSSSSGAWWLMDNFTINESRSETATPVPEPATVLLLGTGVLALVTAKRKTVSGKRSA